MVETESQTRTDPYGLFKFSDPPAGSVSVRVQAPGYATVAEDVDVAPGTFTHLEIRLLQVYAMLSMLVEVPAPAPAPAVAQTAADLLAHQVPGLNSNSGNAGKHDATILLRGIQSLSLTSEPALFLDGIRLADELGGAMDILANIPASWPTSRPA